MKVCKPQAWAPYSGVGTVAHRLLAVAFTVLVFVAGSRCYAADRLVMTGPPAGQEAAKQLMHSLASACNSKDFIGFMGHFTPKQQAAIRRQMEDVFIRDNPEMEIQDVVLLDDGDEKIIFGVRYTWSPKAARKRLFASKVTARKVDGRWKVDSEQIRSRSSEAPAESLSCCGDRDGVAGIAWDPFNPCANGRCPVR